MAKQIICEEKLFSVPGLTLEESAADAADIKHIETLLVAEEATMRFESAIGEEAVNGLRPDVTATSEGRTTLLIEIAVTHFTNADKKRSIREAGIPCVEIDLSKERRALSRDELAKIVLHEVKNKKWICHPGVPAAQTELRARLSARIENENEKIRTQQNSLKASKIAWQKAARIRKQTKSAELRAPIPTTRSGLRWFACKACFHYWEQSADTINPDATHIPCPHCGTRVSTRPAPRGKW
jgi:hypothetical protein